MFGEQKPAVQARVWQGEVETVALSQPKPVWVTVPRGRAAELTPVAEYTQPLLAPLKEGAQVGTVSLELDGVVLRKEPLLVMSDVPEAGFFARMIDKIKLMFE